jgi:hypothetical protein
LVLTVVDHSLLPLVFGNLEIDHRRAEGLDAVKRYFELNLKIRNEVDRPRGF